jgi:hypothetical protein
VATHETTIHPFPAQERGAKTFPFIDRIRAIVDRSHLTTCDWTDVFWDCRDMGTIHCRETEEDLCFRHYVMRLTETPSPVFVMGPKKSAASVSPGGQVRSGVGGRS